MQEPQISFYSSPSLFVAMHSHPTSWDRLVGLLVKGVRPDWHTAMHSLQLQRLLRIYCSGHTGVSGNERADRLASTADITSGLQLGRAEVLRSLRNFLNTDKPEHHSTDRLKEREEEKGSGRRSTLQGRDDLCSTRQILALFRGQPWGDC